MWIRRVDWDSLWDRCVSVVPAGYALNRTSHEVSTLYQSLAKDRALLRTTIKMYDIELLVLLFSFTSIRERRSPSKLHCVLSTDLLIGLEGTGSVLVWSGRVCSRGLVCGR